MVCMTDRKRITTILIIIKKMINTKREIMTKIEEFTFRFITMKQCINKCLTEYQQSETVYQGEAIIK